MTNSKKVIRGGTFITMDKTHGDIINGALLIEGNRITGISQAIDGFDSHKDAEFIDAQGAIVMPGMVDAHRHDWMSLFRGVSTEESLPAFLINTFYAFGSVLTADNMYAAVLAGNISALNAGTTTVYEVNDCVNTPEHALNAIQAMKDSGIRGVYAYGMQVYDFKPIGFKSQDERLANVREITGSQFNGQDRLEMGMLISDLGTVSFDISAKQIKLTDELGIKCASHTGAAKTSLLLRGLRELDDRGLLLPGHLHAHSNGLTGEDWKLVAKTGGYVVSTPSSELQMGMGFLPYRACVEHDIPFALGTDLTGVTTDDMFTQVNIALQIERALANDKVHQRDTMPFEITPTVREALHWVTLGGAEIMGLADEIGSLTEGKKADVIVIRHKDDFVPTMNPAGCVVQMTKGSDVDTVIADGVIRKRDGKLVGFDMEKVETLSQCAFNTLSEKSKSFTTLSPQEVEKFFRLAERKASFNFAQAYSDDYFAHQFNE
ncbi:amidohydrolase family protein [Proteus terrae]|uniref:amidohydrolase family protein n=1 Tax=Proteus terrae TaxID=1574161 RepID=UPI00298CD7FD|nr:amidohydrolase family protein [Proteus terrae]WPC98931.1 amidohydrolase family protein [Proteus terrae]